ncbi:MAG: type II toxin-antitoxin system prevent-host-death family antitoxin [Actinomycetota bacterium]
MVFVGMRELKNKTSEVISKAEKEGAVILTNHGKTRAAIIPLAEEDLEDFLAAHNPKIRKAVIKGMESVRAGEKVYTPEELLKELDRG